MTAETTDVPGEDDAAPKKKSKLPLIIGVVLALAGGGGAFVATNSGLLHGGEESPAQVAALPTTSATFIELDQMTIDLGNASRHDYLRFRAQLEVDPRYVSEVELLTPRVIDVLNTYLRAVSAAELDRPSALIRLRAQMLRRIQVVVGPGRVKDLLVMEFVLS